MLKGVQLTLLIGPAVPVPVPQEVLDALTDVKVTTATGSASGFELSFTLSTQSPLHTLFLFAGGGMPPIIRVIIVATVNGTPDVLMDGVMTNHQVTPGGPGGQSTLTVKGFDLTQVMNYFDFSGVPFPAMPPAVRVLSILAKYAALGVAPLVIPSVLLDVPNPLDRIPLQKGNDLEYIEGLAREVGYVFYIDPGPMPGMSIAYWGPEIKVGVPQPALNMNMDAHTNVEALNFTYDSECKRMPGVLVQNPWTKAPIPIPIPDITPLNPPLGVVKPLPKKIDWIKGTAKLSTVQAAAIGLAKAAGSADSVSASGSLDVLRYGRVLKARKLVGVRGVGLAFDGLYYVESVTHNIKRGQYKQDFTLSRNALVSLTPRVAA